MLQTLHHMHPTHQIFLGHRCILFEYDLATDESVRLVITPTVTSESTAVIRFEINVDGNVPAAYVGPKDVDHLIAFLQRNKR